MRPSSNPRCFRTSIATDVPGQLLQVEEKPESERRPLLCQLSPRSTVPHLLTSQWARPKLARLRVSQMLRGPWRWLSWLRLSLAARVPCCTSKAHASLAHSSGRQLGVSMALSVSSVIFVMLTSASAGTRRREWQCMLCRQAERSVWVLHQGIHEVAGQPDSAWSPSHNRLRTQLRQFACE